MSKAVFHTFIAPGRYVQGRGALESLGVELAAFGKRALILWSARVKSVVGPQVVASLAEAGVAGRDEVFGGACTHAEADRLAALAREFGADVVAGIGGGRVLDTAKAVAGQVGAKTVTCPTVASTDAPTSRYTVFYDAAGRRADCVEWKANPDLVLVDTGVIARAPVRTLAAGMGDGLSTWLEAAACRASGAGSFARGVAGEAALALARRCYDIILADGRAAYAACERREVTAALERVIEANTLLSGIGFESGGCATAHMVANSFLAYPECKGLLHGEEVGFGIVAQLCLDPRTPPEERERIVDFEIAIHLPVTLAGLGFRDVSEAHLAGMLDECTASGSLCYNHPFAVTRQSLLAALREADRYGRERLAIWGGR